MRESDWVDRVAAAYQGGRPLALFFDFDGTLAPLVSHPRLSVLPDDTRATLAALAGLPGVAVGVLSGRALGHLRELVGVPAAWYAGSSGMHLDLGGTEVVGGAVDEFDATADALLVALAEPVRAFPGAWIERKPGCLSVHYRELAPPKAACYREDVREALAFLSEVAPPLRVRDVTRALEITLAAAWTKGDAAERMLAALPPGALAVFAGDGANDEEAVERVNARGGVTIGIGPEPPHAAALRLPTPDALGTDLARLLHALAGARLPSPARGELSASSFTPDIVVPRP